MERWNMFTDDELGTIEWCINNMLIDLPDRTDLHEDEYNTPRYDILEKLLEKVRKM
jgi:hypothetical protein